MTANQNLKDNKQVGEKKIVDVFSEGCISCGMCVNLCPNVFKFNKDWKSYVANQPQTEEDLELAKQSAAGCPVSVITVRD